MVKEIHVEVYGLLKILRGDMALVVGVDMEFREVDIVA